MNEILLSLFAYLVLLGTGFAASDFLFKKLLSFPVKLGLSFGVGSLFYVISMLILSVFNFEWSSVVIILLMIVFIFLYLSIRPLIIFRRVTLTSAQKILLLLIIISAIVPLVESHIRPLVAWDGIASWFLGAKGLYINKTIDPYFYNLMNFDFPPAAHLLIALPGFVIGNFSERGGLMLFNFMSISTIILLFAILSRKISLTYALFITFMYSSTQNVMRHTGYFDVGHVDIVMAYFILCSISLIGPFLVSKSNRLIILFGLFLGLIALTKPEGTTFAVISMICFTVLLIRMRSFELSMGLFPGILIIACWLFYKSNYLPTSPFLLSGNFYYLESWDILITMIKELTNIMRWNMGWIFIALVLPFAKQYKELQIIAIVGILQIGAFFIAYLVSPLNPVLHVQTSFDRLLLQLYPLFLYIAASAFIKKVKLI